MQIKPGSYDGSWNIRHNNTTFVTISQISIKRVEFSTHHSNIRQAFLVLPHITQQLSLNMMCKTRHKDKDGVDFLYSQKF